MVLCVGRVPLVAVWLKPSCRWLAPSSGWPLETVGAWREEGEREARWEEREREARWEGRERHGDPRQHRLFSSPLPGLRVLALRAQKLGETADTRGEGCEVGPAEAHPWLQNGITPRHLVRAVELRTRLVRKHELNVVPRAPFAKPPQQLLHLRRL